MMVDCLMWIVYSDFTIVTGCNKNVLHWVHEDVGKYVFFLLTLYKLILNLINVNDHLVIIN
jgi:hypothetical protein